MPRLRRPIRPRAALLGAAIGLAAVVGCCSTARRHANPDTDETPMHTMITPGSVGSSPAPAEDDFIEFNRYMREWLPPRLTPGELALLRNVGKPVALTLRDGDRSITWRLSVTGDVLAFLDAGPTMACSFIIEPAVFRRIIAAELSPQRAFFTGQLSVEGSGFLALKVGSLLEGIFTRIPYRGEEVMAAMAGATAAHPAAPRDRGEAHATALRPLTDRQRAVAALHLDPRHGTPWWIERAAQAGVTARDLHAVEDVRRLGSPDRAALAARSFRDFVPRRLLDARDGLVLGDTGGTTGAPVTVAWSRNDFETAFVAPLVRELSHRRVPALAQWLFVGPGGPHLIGKAAAALALATTGIDALTVDFDPRWHRRLAPGGTAAARHVAHILEQAAALLRRERIDALFVTPSLLEMMLADADVAPLLHRLTLVHLGGQSIDRATVARFAAALAPSCALINGYGNSLVGCLVEHRPDAPLVYRDHDGDRVTLRLVDPAAPSRTLAPGEWGRVVVDRFDESMMLAGFEERDEAMRWAPGEIFGPRPPAALARAISGGIY